MKKSDYTVLVTLKSIQTVSAENMEEAKEIVKENFKQDFNMEIDEQEIDILD